VYESARRAWWCWDCLRYARDRDNPVPNRLYWLAELRSKAGPDDYYRGNVPPGW
jgi:hypothetical protein